MSTIEETVPGVLQFEANNLKSLTTCLVRVLSDLGFDNPDKRGWELAVSIKSKFDGVFDGTSVSGTVSEYVAEQELLSKTEKVDVKTTQKVAPPVLSSEAIKIVKSNGTKNEKARLLMEMGCPISQVATLLDSSYQRIKNVKKAMDKKSKI